VLISELFELMKKTKLATIAKEHMPFGERPLRDALKKAGYEFSNQAPKGWHYVGEGEQPLDKHIEEFAHIKSISKSNREQNASTSKSTSDSASKSSKKHNASTSKSVIEAGAGSKEIAVTNVQEHSELDPVDVLLTKKARAPKKRTYRGFYFDDDVIAVIDTIADGNKSDLVNEALRKVFRDKGLL
jgi:hypothetical protein